MISFYYKSRKDPNFQQIPDLKPGVWINVENADKKDLRQIAKLTALEYSDIHDSLDQLESPRIEKQEDCIITIIRSPSKDSPGLFTETLMIIVTQENIISISPDKSEVVQKIFENNPDVATTQSTKLLIHILLETAHQYTANIRNVRTEVLRQEKDLRNVFSRDIVKLTQSEEVLNQYLSALVPLRYVYETILKSKYIKTYEEDNDLLDDMINSIRQSVDLCTVNMKSIRSLRDAQQILFTNKLNKTMQLLTSVTILLTIPTIISSIYGMNVPLPFAENTLAFPFVMTLSFGLSGLLYFIFWKNKWL